MNAARIIAAIFVAALVVCISRFAHADPWATAENALTNCMAKAYTENPNVDAGDIMLRVCKTSSMRIEKLCVAKFGESEETFKTCSQTVLIAVIKALHAIHDSMK